MAARMGRGAGSLRRLVACALIASAPGAAQAADWTVTTFLSETASANDNFNLDPDPTGWVFGSSSRLGIDAAARSHVYDFLLSGNLRYSHYFGTAADIPAERLFPALAMSYVRKSQNTTASFGASYALVPGTKIDGLEIETGQSTSDRHTLNANTSIVHKIDPRNDLTLSAKASRVEYVGGTDDGTNKSSLSSSVNWLHRETKRTDLTLSAGVDWFGYDTVIDHQSYLYSVRAGFNTRLSSRLTVTGGAGVRLLDSYSDGAPGDDSTHDTSFGWLGNLGFSYLLKDGALSGSANYGLAPNSDGDLETSLGIRLALSHRINEMSQFRIGTQLRLTDSDVNGALSNIRFSVSPSYSYTLARDWQLSASYQFAVTDGDEGSAHQNAVYLTLSRSYVLLP